MGNLRERKCERAFSREHSRIGIYLRCNSPGLFIKRDLVASRVRHYRLPIMVVPRANHSACVSSPLLPNFRTYPKTGQSYFRAKRPSKPRKAAGDDTSLDRPYLSMLSVYFPLLPLPSSSMTKRICLSTNLGTSRR